MDNIENKIHCDNCESDKVIKNVQLCNVEYDFNFSTQQWSPKPSMINEPIDNHHYCNECYKKWCEGDLF
jgi:hypothetical protein